MNYKNYILKILEAIQSDSVKLQHDLIQGDVLSMELLISYAGQTI